MFSIQSAKYRKTLLSLAVSGALITLASCGGTDSDSTAGGGGGSGGSVDTSSLTTENLRSGLTKGLTQGVTANTSAFSTVLTNSKALNEVTGKASSLQSKSTISTKAAGSGSGSSGLNFDDTMTDSLESLNEMIEMSSVSNSGNVYTFDPDENRICTSDTESTPDEITDCKEVLSHITFVVTVNSVVNDEVTAATTEFKYDAATFAITDFTANSGYYQIELAGSKALLTKLNELADDEDKFDVPATMEGSVRIGFTAESENSGSVTLSIPNAIRLVNTTSGDEIDLTMATTTELLSMSANAATNEMNLKVSLGAFNLLANDEDDSGNPFPVSLALSALTGEMSVGTNGDVLTLSGLSANGVNFKVNGQSALTLGLSSLDAILDASGTAAVATLSEPLNFSMMVKNINAYFADELESTNPAYTIEASATAPAGTTFTEMTDDLTKVTGGPLVININETGKAAVSVSVPTGSCLNTAGDTLAAAPCPAGS